MHLMLYSKLKKNVKFLHLLTLSISLVSRSDLNYLYLKLTFCYESLSECLCRLLCIKADLFISGNL